MGKKKGGKKAWKKIDTKEVDDFLEKSTREERQGLVVEGVPDADLFFVDKAGDEGTVAAVKEGRLPRKLAARQKVLRSAAILGAAHNATPVAKVVPRKPKGTAAGKQQQQHGAGAGAKRGGDGAAGKADQASAADIWDGGAARPPKRAKRGAAAAGGALVAVAPSRGTAVWRPAVPAVEVDPAGCSYNPDTEQHQEAVAVAVAAETRKILDKDLEPVAPPRLVDYHVERDELALLQTLEGDAAADEEEEGEQQGAEAADGREDAAAVTAARRKQEAARKTRKDRKREQRRKDADEELALRRKLKSQRSELSSLKQIEREVDEEEEAQEEARLRRQLDRADRLASEPPKLSRHRFQPMPLQVLTTDELGGSLRRLKPTAMLAKDRFKSLQKRALIEPRRRIEQKKQGKKIEYTQGERAERALERHAELEELKQQRKQAKKAQGKAQKQAGQ